MTLRVEDLEESKSVEPEDKNAYTVSGNILFSFPRLVSLIKGNYIYLKVNYIYKLKRLYREAQSSVVP